MLERLDYQQQHQRQSAEEFHSRGHYKAEEATVVWPYMSYARQETDKSNHAGHGG